MLPWEPIVTATQSLSGNHSLELNQCQKGWWIQSGSVAVFAIATDLDRQGERRYLFSAIAGEVLFGADGLETGYQLLGVTVEPTNLIEFSSLGKPTNFSDFATEIEPLLQTWLEHLSNVFPDRSLSFPTWNSDQGILLFLEHIHQLFFQQLAILEEQEFRDKLARFQERQRLNHQSLKGAVQALATGLRPTAKRSVFKRMDQDDLLVAVGAVGHALGIEIRPPARSENLQRLRDPLDAIARASQFRTRRILLTDQWWLEDSGPLLGYWDADHRPVALLPTRPDRYELFDPQTQTRSPITAELAQQLAPDAYTFYRPFPQTIRSALDVLKFAFYGRERDAIMLVWTGILATGLGMLVPQATAILMDQAIPDADTGLLLQVGSGLIASSFGIAIFQFARSIATLRLQSLADSTSQAALWDRLLKLKATFFRQYTTGDLLARVSAVNQIRQLLGGTVLQTLFTSFFSLLNLGLLFLYSSKLALVAIGLAIITIGVTMTVGTLARRQLRPLEKLQGQLSGALVEMIGAVSKLRVAGAEDRAFAYWSQRYYQQLQLILSTQGLEDLMVVFNRLLEGISPLIIFAIAALMIQESLESGKQPLSMGQFLAFNAAFGLFIHGATDLSNTLIEVLEVGVLWERALPILTEKPELDLGKANPGLLQGNITLDRVTFRYRLDEPPTLNAITMEIKAGEFVALVGPSGSGKSTLVRLLLGFETLEDGAIYYDGQELSALDISAVRRQLGVVLQHGRINSASLFENIACGALITMDEAWEAAQMAGFAEDIQAMPMQMHTVISEGGSNLSGGQRQRLLIARSLVLKPKILIFDEATSALDNRTQAMVSASLDQLWVTRIVIAHRLSTIRNADRIYVLDKGQIVQKGTFTELSNQPGLFLQMMSRQMVVSCLGP